MSYFGIINKEDIEKEIALIKSEYSNEGFEDLDVEFSQELIDKCRQKEIEYLLIEKGIFKRSIISDKMIDYETNPDNSEIEFTFEDFETYLDIPSFLSDEVYKIIYELYIFKVNHLKQDFFDEFGKIAFGLNFHDAKKAALTEFKKIYHSIHFSNPEKSFEIKTSNTEKYLYTPSLLYNLYRQKTSLKNKINTYCYLPYLYGEIDLYNTHPYFNEELINDITLFQVKIDILLELNRKYNFETDIYFNKVFFYKLSSITHQDIFLNSNAYVFTMYIIQNFNSISRSQLESLFEFLVENKLYNSTAEKFMKLINKEFYVNIKTLKQHPQIIGKSAHKTRVENIKKEWINFNKTYFPEG